MAGIECAGIFAEATRDLFVFGEILCAVAVFPEEMEFAYHRLRKVRAAELADAPVEDVQDSRMRTTGKERRFAAAADDQALFMGEIIRHKRVRDLPHNPGIGGRLRMIALFGHEKRKLVVDAHVAVEKPALRQFQQQLVDSDVVVAVARSVVAVMFAARPAQAFRTPPILFKILLCSRNEHIRFSIFISRRERDVPKKLCFGGKIRPLREDSPLLLCASYFKNVITRLTISSFTPRASSPLPSDRADEYVRG